MAEVTSPRERRAHLQADGALALLTVFWGTTFVVVKDALGHGDPFSFLVLRFGLGAVVLSAVAGRRMLSGDYLRRGGLLSLFLFSGYVFQTVGLTHTSPARSAFITGLCVLFVPLLTLVLFRRVPRVPSLVGVVLSTVGLFFLTHAGEEASGGISSGDLLTLAGSVSYALHIVLTGRFAPKEGASALVAVQLWGVALLSAACLPFVETRVAWTGAFVGAVFFCGVLGSAVAISVQTWAQARTGAVRAALIYALEPVFAALFSVSLGYETLGPREWSGGSLIVLGVLVSEVGSALWDRWRERPLAGA
ncbi:DMT family transporter [Stigmatella sp. ncwal1]|uniref:DMT family transporter n=1 Tax=Stigmatella ashevillensis TaxID=2995309 RepID=A0ABT5DC37_9BACT|nr:DMT family transporter [Stigmatella ashevillena]MDC0709906.1 DMT family transporter [Stigmatella ashevillena]